MLKALFKASYTLNRITFAWEDITPVHPSSDMSLKWTKDDADMRDAFVLAFAPAGKTLAALTQQIRTMRPAEFQPRTLIGVGSSGSKALSEGMGWCDETFLYGDDPLTHIEPCKLDQTTKVVMFDRGSLGNAGISWHDKLQLLCKDMKFVKIASESVALTPPGMKSGMKAAMER